MIRLDFDQRIAGYQFATIAFSIPSEELWSSWLFPNIDNAYCTNRIKHDRSRQFSIFIIIIDLCTFCKDSSPICIKRHSVGSGWPACIKGNVSVAWINIPRLILRTTIRRCGPSREGIPITFWFGIAQGQILVVVLGLLRRSTTSTVCIILYGVRNLWPDGVKSCAGIVCILTTRLILRTTVRWCGPSREGVPITLRFFTAKCQILILIFDLAGRRAATSISVVTHSVRRGIYAYVELPWKENISVAIFVTDCHGNGRFGSLFAFHVQTRQSGIPICFSPAKGKIVAGIAVV